MTNNSIYKSIITAKNGTEIPLFENGRSVDSKYNPQRDAENIINSIDSKYSFFIVIGLGSGVLIDSLTAKFPEGKIVCFEKNKNDFDFLLNLPIVQKLKKNNNIIFSTSESLENDLINNYLPAIYGDIKIIEQRGWCQENSAFIPTLNGIINKAIGIISADYSVQCHFGKIWQKNIINNLRIAGRLVEKKLPAPDLSKKAAVVAAGPTLDSSIQELKSNNYYIIATDTTYPVLLNNNIIPDIVISIDGQSVSYNHFTQIKKSSPTIFALDLCSNYTIGQYLAENKCNILYFISGHPFSTLATSLTSGSFPQVFTGAGTVTISALDLAYNLGFTNIQIFGADFSYSNGKPYTKGTYFDKLFGKDNCKIRTIDNLYNKLMFRTDLIKISDRKQTTTMLNAYKDSIELYLKNKNCTFTIEKDIYNVVCKNQPENKLELFQHNFNFELFRKSLIELTSEELKVPLLPYIAWLRNEEKYKSLDFNSLLKLAQSLIVSYN